MNDEELKLTKLTEELHNLSARIDALSVYKNQPLYLTDLKREYEKLKSERSNLLDKIILKRKQEAIDDAQIRLRVEEFIKDLSEKYEGIPQKLRELRSFLDAFSVSVWIVLTSSNEIINRHSRECQILMDNVSFIGEKLIQKIKEVRENKMPADADAVEKIKQMLNTKVEYGLDMEHFDNEEVSSQLRQIISSIKQLERDKGLKETYVYHGPPDAPNIENFLKKLLLKKAEESSEKKLPREGEEASRKRSLEAGELESPDEFMSLPATSRNRLL